MNKYVFVLKNSLQQRMVYRFNTFAFLFSGLINFGVLFYFWSSVYRQGNQVGTYTLQGIVSYYFLATFINIIIRPDDKAWKIADEIRLGGFNNILLRPINYFLFHFFQSVGSLIFVAAAYLPVVFFIIFLLRDSIIISHDFGIIIISIILILMAFVINFIIFFTIGISSFYFGMVKGLNYSVYVIATFLAGNIVPLDIFPKTFMKIANFLPFKYTLYVPIGVLLGRIDPGIETILIPFFWIIFLSMISWLVFKYGIKKYEGYGA